MLCRLLSLSSLLPDLWCPVVELATLDLMSCQPPVHSTLSPSPHKTLHFYPTTNHLDLSLPNSYSDHASPALSQHSRFDRDLSQSTGKFPLLSFLAISLAHILPRRSFQLCLDSRTSIFYLSRRQLHLFTTTFANKHRQCSRFCQRQRSRVRNW